MGGLEKAAILTCGGSRLDRTKQVVTPAKAGVQRLISLDSGFRRNDACSVFGRPQ
jgi:hypothetical protein